MTEVLILGSPVWLVGLALVPMIRELHKGRRVGPALPVPAIFLWRDAPDRPRSGARASPPDPAWRRRALVAALLVAALVDPGWRSTEADRIDLVVDQRPSLLTREGEGGLRVDLAVDALGRAFADDGIDRVRLSAGVGDAPAVSLETDDPAALRSALLNMTLGRRKADHPPDPQPRLPASQRWLLSDGTDPAGLDLASGGFDRVFPTGIETENQGIIRLAARPALDAPDQLDVEVEVANTGHATATRSLELLAGGEPIAEAELEIRAGETRVHAVRIPRPAPPRLAARLAPADALDRDDGLELDTSPVSTRPLGLRGDCGPEVSASVAAHPGLELVDAADAARIWCGSEPPDGRDIPTLWLVSGANGPNATEPPDWIDPELRQHFATLPAGILRPIKLDPLPEGQVLAAAGPAPMVIESAAARRLTASLDPNPAADGAAYLPLAIDALLGRLLGREALLFPSAAAERPIGELRVAPGLLPEPLRTREQGSDGPPRPLWSLFLVGAVAAIAWDLWRTAGARRT